MRAAAREPEQVEQGTPDPASSSPGAQIGLAAGRMLRLQRTAGNHAAARWVSRRRLARSNGDTPYKPIDITAESVRAALGTIRVSQSAHTSRQLEPWDIFKHLPANPYGGGKKTTFNAFRKAHGVLTDAREALDRAERALAGAASNLPGAKRKKLEAARDKAARALEAAEKRVATTRLALKAYIKTHLGWTPDPEVRRLREEKKRLQAVITRLTRGRKPDKEALIKAKTERDDVNAKLEAALTRVRSEIDDADIDPRDVRWTRYEITVGDAVARLRDREGTAYFTIKADALTGSASSLGAAATSVATLIDGQPSLSQSTKKILKIISAHEGNFSTTQTLDVAVVTWGFIQWTTGQSGKGSILEPLKIAKRVAPRAFDARLRRYGLDVNDKLGITLLRPDGTTLTGAAAARFIQTSPELTAVLAAAGTDPDIQTAQLLAGNAKLRSALDTKLTVNVGKDSARVRIGDVITSESGVGVLADRTVHGGLPLKDLQARTSAWAAKTKPDVSKSASTWAAPLEAELIAAIKKTSDPQRFKDMRSQLDTKPGTFR